MKETVETAIIILIIVFLGAYAIDAKHSLEECEQTLFEHLIKVD